MLNINLLVVDDNESDLLLFSEAIDSIIDFLRSKDIIIDIKTTEAVDGIDALDKIKDAEFDMIFLDIKMPRADGIECLTKIKQSKNKAQIIMFTTSDYDEDVKKSYKLGATAYLLKSLDIIEFEENLKSIILIFLQDNFVYINYNKDKYSDLIKK